MWALVERRAESALASGALHHIETEATFLEDAGVEFVCRRAKNLGRKDMAREEGNPFLHPEPELYVADLSATHYALLNKYNVVERHLLAVTKQFVDQQAPLDAADFEALARCMEGADVLGFYNGGAVAGASQGHKHLQIVKLPLSPHRAIPMEALIERDALGELPFHTAFALRGARSDVDLYRDLMGGYRGAYNLLVTHRWMLFVPRSAPAFAGIDVNSIAFAGGLFVRDAEGLRTLERVGPFGLLRAVTQPKD